MTTEAATERCVHKPRDAQDRGCTSHWRKAWDGVPQSLRKERAPPTAGAWTSGLPRAGERELLLCEAAGWRGGQDTLRHLLP